MYVAAVLINLFSEIVENLYPTKAIFNNYNIKTSPLIYLKHLQTFYGSENFTTGSTSLEEPRVKIS